MGPGMRCHPNYDRASSRPILPYSLPGVKEASSPSLLCPILQAQVHLRLRWGTWKEVLKAGWHKEPLLWAEACLIHFPHPQPSQSPTGYCPGLTLTGPFPTAATRSAENPESDHTLPCSHILSGEGWCPLTLEVPPFQKAPSDLSVQSSSFPDHPPRPPSVEFLP